MAETAVRSDLLDWVRRERAAWELLLAEVGAARMAEPGPIGERTFQDLLCHLTAWQQLAQAPLEQALTGACPAPPWPADLDPEQDQTKINGVIYERTRTLPLSQVIREARQTWDRLEDLIMTVPESALEGTSENDEPLCAMVVREVASHYHQDHEVSVRAWLAGFRAPADDV